MSFFDSPLGEQLRSSLDAGKPEDIAAAVAEIEEKVWAGAVQPDQVDEVLQSYSDNGRSSTSSRSPMRPPAWSARSRRRAVAATARC